MHRRLNDITKSCPSDFSFREWRADDGTCYIRIYFLLNDHIFYCDSPISDARTHINISNNSTYSNNNNNNNNNTSNNSDSNNMRNSSQPLPSTSLGSHSSSRKASESSSKHQHSSHSKYSHRHNDIGMLNSQPLKPNNILLDNFPPIEWYEYHQDSSRFFLKANKTLYYFDDLPARIQPPRVPIKVETGVSGKTANFYTCPNNANLVAFSCGGEIWCLNTQTQQRIKITDMKSPSGIHAPQILKQSLSVHDNSSFPDAEPLLVGCPSYLMREEFRRNQSIWWCPKYGHSARSDPYTYKILYEVTDQSLVEIVRISSWDGSQEEQRYPRPGKPNAISRLRLAEFKLDPETSHILDIVNCDITPSLEQIFPNFEYLIRVGWLGHDAIWFQMLNRQQTHLVMAISSLSNSFETQIIYEEKNAYWISTHDITYFLNIGRFENQKVNENSLLSFIWSSEETGHRHLYLVKVRIGCHLTQSKVVFKKQLTEGIWETSEKDMWVDEEEMLIYFCGLRDTPLEKQLYVLSYADCFNGKSVEPYSRTKIHRLTELNYTHSNIAFNADRSVFVNIQSNISVPPFGFVNSIVPQTKFRRETRRLPDSRRLALLLVNSFNYSLFETSHLDYLKSIGSRPSIIYECQADLLPGLARPELFCCQLTNGELIYGSVFKPEFMESGVRYPTVLEIYGGPELQLVSNNFTALRHPARHLLSSEGYVVVIIDCRGSGRRGQTFESYTQRRMGQVEIADQVEVLKWLAENTGYIDLNRVAIKGWSYGGYLALMALAQYPKLFKIAIAGAPVTDWQLYDSAYTERFMGCPSENADGYHKGSVINYVHLFPDQ